MEENIKILEDLAKILDRTCESGKSESSTSIRNLIKELKDSDDLLISMALELRQNEEYIRELEESNKILQDLYWNECIPKSKVEGKIEELNKNELLCKMNFENIKFTIEVLQELKEG